MHRLFMTVKNTVAFSLFFLLMLVGASVHAQSQTINPSGGALADYSDGIEVVVDYQGGFRVIASGVEQLYTDPSGAFNNVTLRLSGPSGNRIYGRNYYFNVLPVSQSSVTGAGTTVSPWQLITVFSPSGADRSVLITVTDSYIRPNLFSPARSP